MTAPEGYYSQSPFLEKRNADKEAEISRRKFFRYGSLAGLSLLLAGEEFVTGPGAIRATNNTLSNALNRFFARPTQKATSVVNQLAEQASQPENVISQFSPVKVAEAATIPLPETTSKTEAYLYQDFTEQQKTEMSIKVKSQADQWKKDQGRLEHARRVATKLDQVIKKLGFDKFFTTEQINLYKGILFTETASESQYKLPNHDAYGPAQLTNMGAEQGAKYLEEVVGLDLKSLGLPDYVDIRTKNDLSTLNIDENLALGLGLFKWLLENSKNSGFAVLGYNAGLNTVNKAIGTDIRNVQELYESKRLASNGEASVYLPRVAAGIQILEENKII